MLGFFFVVDAGDLGEYFLFLVIQFQAMIEQKQIHASHIAVLFLLPFLYWINKFLPWSVALYSHNYTYWKTWVASIMMLHWASVLFVLFLLKKDNLQASDIGYTFNTKKTILFISSYFLLGAVVYFYTEWRLTHTDVGHFPMFYFIPLITPSDRLIWVFAAFSAGFCEELIYRGYYISVLKMKNISNWIAVPLSSLCFTAMHGPGAFRFLWGFCFLFGFGLLMGLLFVWKKKLSLNMAIHMLFDLSVLLS